MGRYINSNVQYKKAYSRLTRMVMIFLLIRFILQRIGLNIVQGRNRKSVNHGGATRLDYLK